MQQLAPGSSTITEVPHKTHQQPVSCVSPWWCFIRRRLTVCLWILCFTRLQNIQSSQQLRVVWFGWTLSSSGRAGGFIWPALSRRRWGWWLEKRIQLLDFAVSADHLMGVYSLLGICWGTRGFCRTGGRRKSWKQSLWIMHISQVLVRLDDKYLLLELKITCVKYVREALEPRSLLSMCFWMLSMMLSSCRKCTSCLVGWTFTSIFWGAISKLQSESNCKIFVKHFQICFTWM